MPRTAYWRGVIGLWSIFSFTTLTRPAYVEASSSTIGPIILHGPHHSAQKSTSTGVSDLRTWASKSASPTCSTWSLMRQTPDLLGRTRPDTAAHAVNLGASETNSTASGLPGA